MLNTKQMVADLKMELKKITLALTLLEPLQDSTHTTRAKRSTKKKWHVSEAGRKKISMAAKKRWAEVIAIRAKKKVAAKKKSPPKAA